MEAFQSAVVVTRQTGNGIEFHWRRPALAVVGGGGKHQIGRAERELRPAYVEVPAVRTARGVGHDPRFVFKWNRRRGVVRDHRESICFPRASTVKRPPDEDSVAGGSLGPVVFRAELVEGDITKNGMTRRVKSYGDGAGSLVLPGRCTRGGCPGFAAVPLLPCAGVRRPRHDNLFRISCIHGNARLAVAARLPWATYKI